MVFDESSVEVSSEIVLLDEAFLEGSFSCEEFLDSFNLT
jgi:hypothetical protein